jgi:hypothetical protein
MMGKKVAADGQQPAPRKREDEEDQDPTRKLKVAYQVFVLDKEASCRVSRGC